MSLLSRLRICLVVLLARDARTWRRLREYCAREQAICGMRAALAEYEAEEAECARQDAIENEMRQVAGGVRLTREAAESLELAQRLTSPRKPC